jgi:hypothetical protein
MWDFLGKLAGVLPPPFLMGLIVFLAGAAVYFLPRVRRDKNGRPYIYSRSYQFQKDRIKAQAQDTRDILRGVDDIRERVRSVELENLKQSFYIAALPADERLISGLKYVYSGGNGSVREDVADFVKTNPAVYGKVIKNFPQWALSKGVEAINAD